MKVTGYLDDHMEAASAAGIFCSVDTEQRPGMAACRAAPGWAGVGRLAADAWRAGGAQRVWGGW